MKGELRWLQLPRERIVDLIWVLEGHDGLAVVRVLDKMRGLVELLVAPDLKEEMDAVLKGLNERHFPLAEVPRPDDIKSIADDGDENGDHDD